MADGRMQKRQQAGSELHTHTTSSHRHAAAIYIYSLRAWVGTCTPAHHCALLAETPDQAHTSPFCAAPARRALPQPAEAERTSGYRPAATGRLASGAVWREGKAQAQAAAAREARPPENFRDFDAVCLLPCCSLRSRRHGARFARKSAVEGALRFARATGGCQRAWARASCFVRAHGHWPLPGSYIAVVFAGWALPPARRRQWPQ
jgi:hypothetical protein